MRNALLLIPIVVAACSPQEFEYLTYDQSQDRHTWQCPNDTFVYEMPQSSVLGSPYQISMVCMGLATRCADRGEGESTPGEAACEATSTNVFRGTCVDDYFAPFDPQGECTRDADGLVWANGARLVGSRENGAYYDSVGELVFVVERNGILDYVYARPL